MDELSDPIGLSLDDTYSSDACAQPDVTTLISEGLDFPAALYNPASLLKMYGDGETSPHSVLFFFEMASTFSDDYVALSISQSIEEQIAQSIMENTFYDVD